jgi:hypothetical protein
MGLALLFVGIAGALHWSLRERPVVPQFSLPWQPVLQNGANLMWIGDGWNWYIAGLLLLLGGLGILLGWGGEAAVRQPNRQRLVITLAMLAAGLLFVGSGNLLTAILSWVVFDLFILIQNAMRLDLSFDGNLEGEENYVRSLSLVGALLLLMGLLPAGPMGPSLEFQTGKLSTDAVIFVLLAAAIRAGIYPFHLWLMPVRREHTTVAERLLEHLVPVLCGLWLLGWAFQLGDKALWLRFELIALLVVSLGGCAIAAWTARQKSDHTTLVLITSANLAALAGALSYNEGPNAMIWPTTAFALGGALWLVGEQVWLGWGWQLPISVGAATLIGIPFTPGFLTQPALARLLSPNLLFFLLFALFLIGQTFQVAALLRSWGEAGPQETTNTGIGVTLRLLWACLAIGLPLAVAGFLPRTLAALASLPTAIPPTLGDPPTVVAPTAIWITLSVPLLAGITTVWLLPQPYALVGGWLERINTFARLDWLFRLAWWSVDRTSDVWGNAVRVVEGSGYMGWLMVLILVGYLLMQ